MAAVEVAELPVPDLGAVAAGDSPGLVLEAGVVLEVDLVLEAEDKWQ